MRRFIIICILLFGVFAACKKAKGPANGKSVQPNNNLDSLVSLSATINGVKWQSDSAFGYYVKNSANDSGSMNLMIVAIKNDPKKPTTFTFIINSFSGLKTYAINPPGNEVFYYVGNNRHLATIGQVIITSDTAYSLKGTFDFVADSITVTNGVFNVARP